MKHRFVLIASIALAPFVATIASAQPAPIVRGEVTSIENGALTLTSASGEKTTLRLPVDARVNVRVPASLADIKPDTYLGTTAKPGPNGTLIASEVHIFPESRRGVGEGHSPLATMPGSTMTNATVRRIARPAPRSRTNGTVVANASAVDHGRTLTLQYKGGEQTVYVSDQTPIVRTEQADRGALTRGAHVIVYAKRDADGSLIAERISVGANGSVPPI
jgi:hypothetical protein